MLLAPTPHLALLFASLAVLLSTVEAGGGDERSCFHSRRFSGGSNCQETVVDVFTTEERVQQNGKFIHFGNDQYCWEGIMRINGTGYYIEGADFEFDCAKVGGTLVTYCEGGCDSRSASSPSGGEGSGLWTGDRGPAQEGGGSRHLTERALLLEQGDTDYSKYTQQCAGFDYNGALVVQDGHFYVVGSPKEDATAAGCPFVATNAVFAGQNNEKANDPYVKQILIWKTKSQQDDLKHFLEDSFHLGTFQAGEVIHAHENINPSKSKNKAYDVINYNCVELPLALASALDVKIDSKMTAFVARRLVQDSGKKIADKIRQSASFLSLFEGRRLRSGEMTDEQVIHAVVDKRVTRLSQ